MDTDVLDNSIIYICGPPGMVKAMQSLMREELDCSKDRIKVDDFLALFI